MRAFAIVPGLVLMLASPAITAEVVVVWRSASPPPNNPSPYGPCGTCPPIVVAPPAQVDPSKPDLTRKGLELDWKATPQCPVVKPLTQTRDLKPDDCKPLEAKQPDAKQPTGQDQQVNNQTVSATEAGTQPGALFNPYMFGDLLGPIGRFPGSVPSPNPAPPVPVPLPKPNPNGIIFSNRALPVTSSYNGFKVTDNDTPRPVDRVYTLYNNFSEVGRSTAQPGSPNVTVNRELIGFEKTFLAGNASFGVRLPFIQTSNLNERADSVVGDLNLIFKFAWINDRQTNNIASSGLILTAPTGGGTPILADGVRAPHSTLFQPWTGFIYNFSQAYVQSFSSIVVPSDGRDPTILFNSISAGYWLYRNTDARYITAVVPVLEFHLNTPLNHRSPNDEIYFQDQLNITPGLYVMSGRSTFGAALGVPVVGPRPYNLEAIASFNFRF